MGKPKGEKVTGFCFFVQSKDSDISNEYLLTSSCHDIADPLFSPHPIHAVLHTRYEPGQ